MVWTPDENEEDESMFEDKPAETEVPETPSANAFGGGTFVEEQTAEEAARSLVLSVFKKIPQNFALDKGTFTLNMGKTSEGNKIPSIALQDSNEHPIKHFTFKIGPGTPEEGVGHVQRSMCFLKAPMKKVLQQVLDYYYPAQGFKVGPFVSSKGNHQGGVEQFKNSEGQHLPTAVWDKFIMGLMTKDPELQKFWASTAINWTDGGSYTVNPPMFNEGGDIYKKALNSKYFVNVEEMKTTPQIVVPEIPEGKSGRTLTMARWAGDGFIVFRAACAVVFAKHQQVDVSSALRGSDWAKFETWFSKLELSCFAYQFDGTKTKVHHPKFWVPLKKDYDMSLWQAINNPTFPNALDPNAKSEKMSEEKAAHYWLSACGDRYVTKDRVLTVKEGAEDPRKKL